MTAPSAASNAAASARLVAGLANHRVKVVATVCVERGIEVTAIYSTGSAKVGGTGFDSAQCRRSTQLLCSEAIDRR